MKFDSSNYTRCKSAGYTCAESGELIPSGRSCLKEFGTNCYFSNESMVGKLWLEARQPKPVDPSILAKSEQEAKTREAAISRLYDDGEWPGV